MKQYVVSICLMLLTGILFSSCKNHAPREAGFIPKEITAVVAVDPKSLQDKLEKEGISIDTLMDRVFKKGGVDSSEKRHFLELKNASGIDWNARLYLFTLNKSEEKLNIVNLMAGIKDASAFEHYLKNTSLFANKNIQRSDKYAYILPGNETIIAWNNQTVIASLFHKEIKPYYDTIAMKFVIPSKGNMDSIMKSELNKYFNQKESESLASVSEFSNLFSKKADGYLFSSTTAYYNMFSAMPFQLPKLEDMLKDNYLAASLSFEAGKIVATSSTYTNPFLSNILKKYAGPVVDLSLIDHYPSDNINMIMMASFNPEIFNGVLQQLEVEGLINGFMEKTGLSTKDLYAALKGDIAVVVSDLSIPGKKKGDNPHPMEAADNKQLLKMIMVAPMGDAKSFAKLMDKAVESGYIVKHGKQYNFAGNIGWTGLYLHVDDKQIVIASDSVFYNRYVSNKNRASISNDALNQFKGKSGVAYFDVAGTINGWMANSGIDFKNSMLSAKQAFKDVIATSDNFDGKSIKSKLEIRLKNEKQNSLATLISLVTDIAVDMRMAAKKEMQEESSMFPAGVPTIIRTN